jgi:hypothetical protein
MDAYIEKLKKLDTSGLCREFNTTQEHAGRLKHGIEHYDTLSNNSLSLKEMANIDGITIGLAKKWRCALIESGLVEKGLQNGTERIKKLLSLDHYKGKHYGAISLSEKEFEAANLNPEKNYFYIVEPKNKELTVKLFEDYSKAFDYKKQKLQA